MSGDHNETLDLRIGAVFIVMICAALGTIVAPVIVLIVKRVRPAPATDVATNSAAEADADVAATIVVKRVIRVLTALSCGIIIGTALLHLLPEASHLFESVTGEDSHDHAAAEGSGHSDGSLSVSSHSGSHAHSEDGSHHHHEEESHAHSEEASHDHEHEEEHDHEHEHEESSSSSSHHHHPYPYTMLIATFTSLLLFIIEKELHACGSWLTMRKREKLALAARAPAATTGTIDDENADKVSAVTSTVVSFALSIHSILLGLTVGLLTEYGVARALVIAVACDQFADGVAVGATLADATSILAAWQQIALRVVFSLSCAVGVAIGIIVDQAGGGHEPAVQGAFAAISGGMLLVMAYTHILGSLVDPITIAKGNYAACGHSHDAHPEGHHVSVVEMSVATPNKPDTSAIVVPVFPAPAASPMEELSLGFRGLLYLCAFIGLGIMAVIANWG